MPIRMPAALPAGDVLRNEGVMVMDEDTANRQDIRPLQFGLLNLMPDKARTEVQFSRLLGATPLQIELTLIRMSQHQSKLTASDHLDNFYIPFFEAKAKRFDGLIITGAPVEQLAFHDVTYMDELREIFDWTQENVQSTLGVCWGGMAMINHFHGIEKHMLDAKAFGCFRHRNLAPTSPYLRGFSDDFTVPVSRWTEIRENDVRAASGLDILMSSDEVGVCTVDDPKHRALYMFNHLEYDSTTLKAEYDRDVAAGGPIDLPVNYFPGNDPSRKPENRWRSHAHLFFGNWVNEVYQTTEYDLGNMQPTESWRHTHG
ncbi:homoserine O-succinyltransferase [Paracoccaceae bacterium GXU_MW_L88]